MFQRNKKIIFLGILILFFIFYVGLEKRVDTILHITQTDPLFYSPEVNTDKLHTEVQKLSGVHGELLGNILKRINEETLTNSGKEIELLKKIIEEGFLPTEYLKRLPTNIEKTETFLANPGVRGAFSMLISNYRTASKYRIDAEKFHRLTILGGAFAKTPSFTFEFPSSAVNKDTMLNDAELVNNNGKRLVEETYSRLACFLLGVCKKDIILQSQERLAPQIIIPRSFFETLPDDLLSGSFEDSKYSKDLVRSGPYVVESGCFPKTPVLLYIFKDPGYGFFVKQADENYYFDLRTMGARSSEERYSQHFIDQGIYFDDQPEGTDYRCRNLTYWGDLSVIDYFAKTFTEEDIENIEDVEIFLDEKKNISEEEYNKYRIIFENKMVDLPLMLSQVRSNLDFYNTVLPDHTSNVFSMYLLGVRSAFSLTFNTFSKSVWRVSENPTYYTSRNTQLAPIYKTYSDLKKEYSDEEIKQFHQLGNQFFE